MTAFCWHTREVSVIHSPETSARPQAPEGARPR